MPLLCSNKHHWVVVLPFLLWVTGSLLSSASANCKIDEMDGVKITNHKPVSKILQDIYCFFAEESGTRLNYLIILQESASPAICSTILWCQ